MRVLQQTGRVARLWVFALALFVALFALWAWVQTLLHWGDPQAMATALTWTVATLFCFGLLTGIERLQRVV